MSAGPVLSSSMNLIHPLAETYAKRYTTSEDPLLRAIAQETIASHPESQMLSGHLQGKLLEIFSILVQPRNVLEIGTYMGYSALCLVKGLAKNGKLHTIEVREETAAIARANFARSNENDRIILHTGNALAIIPGLEEQWDLVFIDADKTNYIQYYQLVLPRLRKGGIILADNVLFHGEVLEEPVKGKNAKAIQAFNEYVAKDDSVDRIMLTVRDGLFLIRKK